MDDTPVRIQYAQDGDLEALVSIHLDAFEDHRSAQLGGPYVRSVHGWFLKSPETINLVAVHGDRIAGFAQGAYAGDVPAMDRSVRLAALRCLLGAPHLLLDRRMRYAILQRIRSLFDKRSERFRDLPEPVCVLLSIAVDESVRCHGIGSSLLEAFETEARKRGFASLRLSVYKDNEAAIRAYQKAGWNRLHVNDESGYYFWKDLKQTVHGLPSDLASARP